MTLIDEDKTYAEKGYRSTDLSYGSKKKIYAVCEGEDCQRDGGRGRWVEKRRYYDLCRLCACRTDEYREKQRILQSGENNGMYGRHQNERNIAIEMRKSGAVLSEIVNSLDVSKSTAWLWTKDVELSDEAKQRIDEMSKKTQFKKGNTLRSGDKWTDEMRRDAAVASRERYYNNDSIRNGFALGNSVHRKDEKAVKDKIEMFFNTSELLPEKIGDNWFDFVNDEFIIEYTVNFTRGISLAISRFGNITDDKRKKILISHDISFGYKRKARLDATGAIFIPIDIVINKRSSAVV